jgi:prolyl-tRNA synthetase
MESEKKGITAKKKENFSEWYTQTVIKSEFIDYTSVSGELAFRPDSYFVWETLQKALDLLFKKDGIQNVYFPMLIPEHLFEKEKEHVKGFSPEVAWVTHAGGSKLDERLAVRPTSETIMYDSYSKWIRSWRDLPMRLNQWNSVIRWEFKHPTPLLRSREFLWNEGHTVFSTAEEAEAERSVILDIYEKVLKEYLALPGILGRKTETEKFAGAVATYSIEHMMPDGKAVQGPDFHNDGQNFSKAFEISFIDKDGQKAYAYQNTFGITTRELGAMVMTHGDDRGLVMPPKVSRIQVVIVPIYRDQNRKEVLEYANQVSLKLKGKFRVYLDDSDAYSPGWKFNNWEMKGVPVRVEIGAKEVEARKAVLVRRDLLAKESVDIKELESSIDSLMEDIHESMFKKAKAFLEASVHKANTYPELKAIVETKGGFVQAGWCGSAECEAKAKTETGAKITNMPFDAQKDVNGKACIVCGSKAKYMANFARSH